MYVHTWMYIGLCLPYPVSFALLFERKYLIQTVILRPQTYANSIWLFCVTSTRTGDHFQCVSDRQSSETTGRWRAHHLAQAYTCIWELKEWNGEMLSRATVSSPGTHPKWVSELEDRERENALLLLTLVHPCWNVQEYAYLCCCAITHHLVL